MKSVTFYFSLLFSALISFYSCKKDVSSGESESSKFSIEEAKTWFTKEIQPRNSSSKISKTFTVLWTTARASEDNKHFIMECHLKFDQTPGFLVKDSGKQVSAFKQINGDIRLVLLKSKTDNEIRAFLMNMYSNTGSILEKNSYCNVDKDFDGFVFFTDLEGRFVNGWQYQAGDIIRSSKTDGKSKKSNSSLIGAFVQPVDECGWVQFDTYQRTCFYENDILTGCTEWQFMYSELQYFCNDGGGSPGTVYEETAVVAPTFTSSSESVDVTTTYDQTGNTRQKRYKWIFLRNISLTFYSYDKSMQQKGSDGKWRFQSLEHVDNSMVGTYAGWDVSYALKDITPTIGQFFASMHFDCEVTSRATYLGRPIVNIKSYPCPKYWDIDDGNTVQ
jgi:hypothetical protein